MRPGGGGNEAYLARSLLTNPLAFVLSTVKNIPSFHSLFMSLRFGVEQKLCHTPFLETIAFARPRSPGILPR